jgi:phage terminase large subunit-like protein
MSEARARALARLRRERPEEYRELVRLIAESERRDLRRLYEDSLAEFFKRAWQVIDPAPMKWNWHHGVICDYLTSVSNGEIKRLLINIPPGCTKTNLASVCWPMWIWAQPRVSALAGPQAKFMSITYGHELSTTIARLARRLVTSDWYQGYWGSRVQLNDDQSGLENFGNTAGGFRIATSLGGSTLGRRGDVLILDDVHKVDEAESQIERENVIRSYDESLATRVTDPETFAEVIIMQRLHEEDLSGHVLDRFGDQFTHLMLPMEYDPSRACAADIRTVEGELLWGDHWTREAVERTKTRLGPYGAAGQLAQSPTPRGGAIIGIQDWATYPETVPAPGDVRRDAAGRLMVPLPEMSYVVAALDTAVSEREMASWSAMATFGVWHRRKDDVRRSEPWFSTRWAGVRDPDAEMQAIEDEDNQPRAILAEAWRRRCKLNSDEKDKDGKPAGLVQRVIDNCRRRRVDLLIIENKTLGKSVADEIRRQTRREEFQILMFEPRKYGDKTARIHSIQPLFSQKLIYAPGNPVLKTDKLGNTFVDIEEFVWVQMVIQEISQIPRGRFDDLADAVAMCLLVLRENGFLELTQEYTASTLQQRMWRGKRRESIGEHYGVVG